MTTTIAELQFRPKEDIRACKDCYAMWTYKIEKLTTNQFLVKNIYASLFLIVLTVGPVY